MTMDMQSPCGQMMDILYKTIVDAVVHTAFSAMLLLMTGIMKDFNAGMVAVPVEDVTFPLPDGCYNISKPESPSKLC